MTDEKGSRFVDGEHEIGQCLGRKEDGVKRLCAPSIAVPQMYSGEAGTDRGEVIGETVGCSKDMTSRPSGARADPNSQAVEAER